MALRFIGGPRHGQTTEDSYWGPVIDFRYVPAGIPYTDVTDYVVIYGVDPETRTCLYQEIAPRSNVTSRPTLRGE